MQTPSVFPSAGACYQRRYPTTRTLGLLVGLRGGPAHASQTATRQANRIRCGRDWSWVTPGRDGGRRAPHSVIPSVSSGRCDGFQPVLAGTEACGNRDSRWHRLARRHWQVGWSIGHGRPLGLGAGRHEDNDVAQPDGPHGNGGGSRSESRFSGKPEGEPDLRDQPDYRWRANESCLAAQLGPDQPHFRRLRAGLSIGLTQSVARQHFDAPNTA